MIVRRIWGHLRSRTRRHFLTGLLVIVPLGITYYVISAIVQFMDRTLEILPSRFHPDTHLGFRIPGLGVILTLLIIQAVGMLAANLLGRSVVGAYEQVLQKIPGVRWLYVGIKQLLEQMISDDEPRFRKVVLVEYPRPGMYSLAFVTGQSRGDLQEKVGERLINVFIPTTPNPTSGFYLLVPERDAVALDLSVDDAFKLIVSAGIVGGDGRQEKARPGGPERASATAAAKA